MSDTEKITINMSAVDLGKIDLLVQESLYSNRADFIRTAIRGQLEKHNLELQQTITRYSYVVGVLGFNAADFERYKARGEKVKIVAVGVLRLANDITPELAREVVETVQVRGIFQASEAVKVSLADRTR